MTRIYAPAKPSLEEFLAHHGVKGMKWGVTRDEALLNRIAGRRMRATGGTKEERKTANAKIKKDWKDYKTSTSRKQRKLDRNQVTVEKFKFLLDSVGKDPFKMIQTKDYYGNNVLMTGKEFADKAMRGQAFNIAYTDISDWRING